MKQFPFHVPECNDDDNKDWQKVLVKLYQHLNFNVQRPVLVCKDVSSLELRKLGSAGGNVHSINTVLQNGMILQMEFPGDSSAISMSIRPIVSSLASVPPPIGPPVHLARSASDSTF